MSRGVEQGLPQGTGQRDPVLLHRPVAGHDQLDGTLVRSSTSWLTEAMAAARVSSCPTLAP